MQKNRLIDNTLCSEREALRALDPDLTDQLLGIITRYTPNPRNSAWTSVRRFVLECVISMKPRTVPTTRRLLSMTALYAMWVWTVSGTTLEPARVFRDTFVRRYLAEAMATRSEIYRYDLTRQLSTIAEALSLERIPRLRTPFQSPRVQPFTADELATLYSWANTLSTPLKRQNARALLGLAGGAGLTALELMSVQVEDVQFDNGRAFVTVNGSASRRVPVRAMWVKTLSLSIGTRTSGNVFHAYRLEEYPPNQLQRFLSDNPCKPRPSAARFHAGWVVTQIEAGLPLQILLDIAGFSSAQSLQPYLKYAKTHGIDDCIARITGEEVV